MQEFSRRQFLGCALASAVVAGWPVGVSGRRLSSSEVLVAASAPLDEVPPFLRDFPAFAHVPPGPDSTMRILEAIRASRPGRLVVYCDSPTLLGLLQSRTYLPSIYWVNPSLMEPAEADILYRLRDPGLPRPHLSVCGAQLSDCVATPVIGFQANLPEDMAVAKQAMLQRLLCVAGDPQWGVLRGVYTQGLNWRLMRLEFSGGRSAVFSRGRRVVEGVRTRVRFVPGAWMSHREGIERYIATGRLQDDAGRLWKAWELTEAAFKAVKWDVQASAPGLRKGAFL